MRHDWKDGTVEYRVDASLYPEGIYVATGMPAGAVELATEILRLAERERKLREKLLALVLACDHNQGDYNKALADARALLKEE